MLDKFFHLTFTLSRLSFFEVQDLAQPLMQLLLTFDKCICKKLSCQPSLSRFEFNPYISLFEICSCRPRLKSAL